jgi:hypothetical protein
MSWIDPFESERSLTTQQQWSTYFLIAWGIIALVIVLNARQRIITASSIYTNNEAGIIATYPSGWLIDESDGSYVFRARNMQEVGFKTAYQVSLRPISPSTTTRTIIDSLALQRSQTLAAYRILSSESFQLSQTLDAQQITYTYVDSDSNPFLETIPVTVVGIDIISISRGQAVIITLLSDANHLTENRERFFDFVDQLEF